MFGVYIHIPYCHSRCTYCDFYTQTNTSSINEYVGALAREIVLRKDFISGKEINTIYFGGGTPSVLKKEHFDQIFETLDSTFNLDKCIEITLEANPEDLNSEYFKLLKNYPINRLSIGIQSFEDDELKLINRRHNAEKAITSIKMAQDFGYDNISIDLIYGLPNQTLEIWIKNIQTALELNTSHISAYHLIYEPTTKLYKQLKSGMVKEIDEDLSLAMFSELIKRLSYAGYEHYEISNFAKDKKYAQHNTSYWLGTAYLGLGASAHSFDKLNRIHNVASINQYVEGIKLNQPKIETEVLSTNDQYNEYVLTRLRTHWGLNLEELTDKFGDYYRNYFVQLADKYVKTQHLIHKDNNQYFISFNGIFISDKIMSDLIHL